MSTAPFWGPIFSYSAGCRWSLSPRMDGRQWVQDAARCRLWTDTRTQSGSRTCFCSRRLSLTRGPPHSNHVTVMQRRRKGLEGQGVSRDLRVCHRTCVPKSLGRPCALCSSSTHVACAGSPSSTSTGAEFSLPERIQAFSYVSFDIVRSADCKSVCERICEQAGDQRDLDPSGNL